MWRHGQSEWNVTGRFQGQLESPLDAVGVAQAATAAAALALLRPAAILTSDLARARDTAAALSELTGVPAVPEPRLREVDVGEWGGLTRAEVEARFPEQYAAWLSGEDSTHGRGETFAQVAVRAREAVLEHLDSVAGGPLVAVTHGGTGRSLVVAMLGLDPVVRHRFAPLGNGRWAALARGTAGWSLSAYNTGPDELETPVALDAAPPPA